ncbi:hypothetical protein [Odoribacter lunatus]|uniref:hypothetical protein n=1 Tax=Odoribacter lunatus TaxID=2941335 RepID=UPI00203C871A|nr:hypothetical protein [Odoribacter lunatus]
MDTIVVNDTNVFIDLCSIDLLDDFFKLSQKIHTTDFIINELVKKEQRIKIEKFIETKNLTIKIHTSEELMEIVRFQQEQDNNVSIPDCSVWLYAQKNHYRLLTGDNKLRKSAIKSGATVSGILYVFDQLIEQGILSPKTAAEKLNLLRNINNRLPDKDIAERLKKWDKNEKS